MGDDRGRSGGEERSLLSSCYVGISQRGNGPVRIPPKIHQITHFCDKGLAKSLAHTSSNTHFKQIDVVSNEVSQ